MCKAFPAPEVAMGQTQPRGWMVPHLSWWKSMLTTSLKRLGSFGEKKPLLIWSTACFSSGSRS